MHIKLVYTGVEEIKSMVLNDLIRSNKFITKFDIPSTAASGNTQKAPTGEPAELNLNCCVDGIST